MAGVVAIQQIEQMQTKSTISAFDADLIRRYDGLGPRYTSYPTANYFTADFTRENYQALCAASNAKTPPKGLSVYVHIPFCKTLCYYCACSKIVTRHPEKAATYMQRLYREIDLQARLFDQQRALRQLHFGGGTPTFLSADQMTKLMAHLESGFGFAPPGEREFSIEIDPRTLRSGSLDVLRQQGFDRVSFGVQDLDPKVQAAVNRLQPADMTLAAIEDARAAGFGALSLDLIYGLPHQTPTSFGRTLEQIIAFRPERLAIYNYAHLPGMFRAQKLIRQEDLPDAGQKLQIFSETVERLTEAGYVYIGLDHFALPDDDLVRAQENRALQRNFQGYSTHADCDLVGLGMTAIGKVGDGYAQNHKTLAEYYAAIDGGELAIARGLRLGHDDRLRRAVIQALMCHSYVDGAKISAEFDIDFLSYFSAELNALAQFADDGLVEVAGAQIHVSDTGRFLLRPIAMVFDAYLKGREDAGARYSRVV